MPEMRVIFFGTPAFAAELLATLIECNIDIVAVVTKPDRPQGRSEKLIPSEVKQMAEQQCPNSPLFQPTTAAADDFFHALADLQADLFVVVAYGEIIKQRLLDLPRFGCINVHASLLPKYRGAAPIQRSIIEGEMETGVTIMQMVKKMDAGDIIQVAKVPIGKDTTYGQLERALCQAAKRPLLDVIAQYASGIRPPHRAQEQSSVTFADKIEPKECQINWHLAAEDIHNLIRGVNPHPGAWCYVDVRGEQKRLKISQSACQTLSQAAKELPVGTLLPEGPLLVRCGQGALALLEVQLEGKRKMLAEEFLRGGLQFRLLV